MYAGNPIESTGNSTSVHFVFSALFDGANSETYFNGSSIITGDAGSDDMSAGLEIGSQGGGNLPWFGAIQEWIIYDSDQSSNRTLIEANINDYFNIEGV
jgi:hypothetical protein